ncbi:hypothetical protein SNE40_007066 [Patella caerulea]|uniref:Integrase catalytic domain-containing protein n=1 Tax=Patella caerulea TaxID=87958 RepID=A0AAN8Q1U4_PATCE
MVYKSESGAEGLVKRLRETFVTFGIPEELVVHSSRLVRHKSFYGTGGVRHRLCPVANPHANSRAELAVKTVKRMLVDNTSVTGSVDNDKFQRGLLVYRNSIDQETKASPALILFGRLIRDPIPILMGRYQPHETWKELLFHRERALAKRHSREHEKWTEHTRKLLSLVIEDHVFIQNLVGNQPRQWERTGLVIEVRQFHQYVVRVDGTGRVTLRNRQHLRKFTPFLSKPADLPLKAVELECPKSPSLTHEHIQHPKLLPAPSPMEFTIPDARKQPDLPPPQQTLDPAVDATPPVQAVKPRLSTPINQDTGGPKIPRALARLQPHNTAGDKELLPPRRAGRKS